MEFFRGETVTIISKSINMNNLNDYGLPAETTTQTVVKNVLVDFTSTNTASSVEEQALQTQVTLYFPAGTIIKEEDMFIIRNTKWEQVGLAEDKSINPFGNSFLKAGTVVKVKQHKGNVE